MGLEIRHLEQALALAEARNFARAAKSLHLSQSALSRSIQGLEKHFGVALFERGGKGVEPTEAGEVFLKRAEGMMARIDEVERDLMAVGARQQPQLRIGFGPYAAHMLGGRTIARCLGGDPNRRFRVSIDHWASVARRLRDGDLDIAICELSELSPKGLEIVPLEPQAACVVLRCGHPLLELEEVRMEDVMAYPMVGTSRLPPRVLDHLLPAGGREGFNPAVHCEDLSLLEQVLMESDAVGLGPPSLYEPAVRRGELCLLDCLPPEISTRFGLIRLEDRRMPEEAHEFVREVLEVDRESAALSRSLREEGWVQERRPRSDERVRKNTTSTTK